jgi:multidrug efflux pump subunit AcrA (membrane-fusion protein)
MKPVRVGPETNGVLPVLDGLAVGDRVVTQGSFLLRAEWNKSHAGQ